MRTIDLSTEGITLDRLLELASEESVVLKTIDGREYLLAEIEDLEEEIELIRNNEELMAFLDERSRDSQTYTHGQVREILNSERP